MNDSFHNEILQIHITCISLKNITNDFERKKINSPSKGMEALCSLMGYCWWI